MDEQLQKIEKYLRGELNEIEMKAFEKKIQEDKNLYEEVELFKDMLGGLRLRNNKLLKNKLNEIHEKAFPENKQAKVRTINWKQIAIAFAASVALVITFFYFQNQKSSSDSLYATYYTTYQPDWSTRGDNGQQIDENIKSLYESKNYKALLSSLEKKGNDAKFFMLKGSSNLELEQYAAARNDFENAANNPLYKSTAQWYIALSYLKEKDIEKCKSILNSFANNSTSDYHNEAKELLEEL